MSKLTALLLLSCAATILIVFNSYLTPGLITAGDLWHFFNSMYPERDLPLNAWDQFSSNGFGAFSGPYLWVHLNFGIPITVLGTLGLSWSWIERLAYFLPFLLLATLSPMLLARELFPKNNLYPVSGLLYILNTYILMIVGGGQIAGIGMAYALLPLVMLFWIKAIKPERLNIFGTILFSLTLSLQIMYDLRIAYITIVICGTYMLFVFVRKKIVRYASTILLTALLVFLLNAYWIVPSILVRQNPFSNLGSEYSSIDAVRFFSFAKLENTMGLLHPNWPTNIFGMTAFFKGSFLILPMIAFASLIRLPKETTTKKNILFLALIALLGIFLGKGTQDPLGPIYILLFENVPGFILFRDPTKWIVIVSLAYALLIPYAIREAYIALKNKYK